MIPQRRVSGMLLAASLVAALAGVPALAFADGELTGGVSYSPDTRALHGEPSVTLAASTQVVEEAYDSRNDAAAFAEVIAYNKVIHGSMSYDYDRDWYKLSLPHAGDLSIVVNEGSSSVMSLGWKVKLWTVGANGAVGSEIACTIDASGAASGKYTYSYGSCAAGDYLVYVEENADKKTGGASYLVDVQYGNVDFSKATLIVEDVQYDGSPKRPEPVVMYEGQTLLKGVDYVIGDASYKDNVNVGIAQVTVTGTGIYAGTATQSFRISDPGGAASGSGSSADGGKDEQKASGSSASKGASGSTSSKKSPKIGRDAMYRLYNPYTGEHFFTGSKTERNVLIRKGWKSEGIGWYAPDDGNPVYRLYNPYTGDHHFTKSSIEARRLVRVGWQTEGLGWYSASAKDENAVEIYRQYNPYSKAFYHNYTAERAENDHLVKVGWRAEGVGWYGVK